jgi:methylase of polypeptide subunit release factors
LDSDLSALASRDAQPLAHVLADIIRAVHFDVVNRELRLAQYGGDYDVRPFPLPGSPVDVTAMKVRLRQGEKTSPTADEHGLARRIRYAFSFFMFGEALAPDLLKQLFGKGGDRIIDEGLELELFARAEGQTIRMNGLSLFSTRLENGDAIHLFADTPPYFQRRTEKQRVYIGADSYELMHRISRMRGIRGCCVEMGAGSGIQLVAALKQHSGITMAFGMERDRRAANVSVFNAALNGVADKLVIVENDLRLHAALGGRPVSAAFSNPPFLAMPRWVDLDPGDRATVGALADTRETEGRTQLNLQSLFPDAGWGGDDGLEITASFIETLSPILAPAAPFVIYSQFAGDHAGPMRIREYSHNTGFEFTFEPLPSRPVVARHPQTNHILEGRSRPVLSSEQAAETIARLIVSALLARREPRRIQTAVRKGSPEQRLVSNLSAGILVSYLTRGISHFHDGFAVLIKQPAHSNS